MFGRAVACRLMLSVFAPSRSGGATPTHASHWESALASGTPPAIPVSAARLLSPLLLLDRNRQELFVLKVEHQHEM